MSPAAVALGSLGLVGFFGWVLVLARVLLAPTPAELRARRAVELDHRRSVELVELRRKAPPLEVERCRVELVRWVETDRAPAIRSEP
jgi:hypothetical protein